MKGAFFLGVPPSFVSVDGSRRSGEEEGMLLGKGEEGKKGILSVAVGAVDGDEEGIGLQGIILFRYE